MAIISDRGADEFGKGGAVINEAIAFLKVSSRSPRRGSASNVTAGTLMDFRGTS
jgi:hypothetical protein